MSFIDLHLTRSSRHGAREGEEKGQGRFIGGV